MSVTFGTSPVPVSHYAFTCGHDNGVTAHEFPTHRDAYDFLTAELELHKGTGHLAVCGDEYCRAMFVSIHAVEIDPTPSVQVSNSNAVHVLRVLGLESSTDENCLMGSCGAEEFLTRIRTAESSGFMRLGTGHYFSRLSTVAEVARQRSLEVQWA